MNSEHDFRVFDRVQSDDIKSFLYSWEIVVVQKFGFVVWEKAILFLHREN